MTVYQEYPKTMNHPNYVAAVIGKEPREGSPAKFPPVIVNSADQEEEYLAKGYHSPKNNRSAFDAAHAAPGVGHVHEEYPKWVDDGTTHPDGSPKGVTVHNEDQEIELLSKMQAKIDKQSSKRQPKTVTA